AAHGDAARADRDLLADGERGRGNRGEHEGQGEGRGREPRRSAAGGRDGRCREPRHCAAGGRGGRCGEPRHCAAGGRGGRCGEIAAAIHLWLLLRPVSLPRLAYFTTASVWVRFSPSASTVTR